MDPVVRGEYLKKLKVYKKKCRQARRQFREDLLTKLDDLHNKYPKEYWELVNKLRSQEPDSSNKIDPSEWLNYFTNLGKEENFKMPSNLDHIYRECQRLEKIPNFSELDYKITEKEIMTALLQLKNNKSCGPDGICNELLKYSTHVLLNPIIKLFNLIYTAGQYPSWWARGFIKPLHKKDNPLLAENYRGITITSVIGKLFNSVINNRIVNFLKKHKIMHDEQIGFQKKCRTSDHIFILKTLMDHYRKVSKSLFFCFVDFQKAFDSVSHICLFYKLLKLNFNGHVYRVIKSMNSQIKLQVKVSDGLTEVQHRSATG